MKAFILKPGKPGEPIEIENPPAALYAAVGWHIGYVELDAGGAAIFNVNGKIDGLSFNRAIYAGGMDRPVRYLYGNVLIVGMGGEGLRDLTPAELDALTHDHRASTSGVTIRRRSA